MRTRPAKLGIALAVASGAWWGPARADESRPAAPDALSTQFTHEVGAGYESQSSPLVRFSPESSLVLIDGLSRRNGAHGRVALTGMADLRISPQWNVSMAADALVKHAPRNRDLDFAMASIQPLVRWSHESVSIGAGPAVQRFDVAGRHFRTSRGLHADVNWLRGNDRWSLMVDGGRLRHTASASDLDARTNSVVLQHHLDAPLPGIDAIEWGLHGGRERNIHGYADLSHRTLGFSTSLQRTAWGLDWSLGVHSLLSRFDEATFPGESARRDRSVSADLAVEMSVGEASVWRLEFIDARNRSNSVLYDNRYQQLATSLRTSW